MKIYKFFLTVFLALLSTYSLTTHGAAPGAPPPNILLIYTDDVGYGDVGCYGTTRIKTPNIDKLASRGLRFTDGHCTSATCTPSRFGMLTGQYPWRKKGTGILSGQAGMIIRPGQATMASVLKDAGYTTGVVGKWHLGLGDGGVDWNKAIKPGPLEIGFDYSYLIPATGDRVPCVYVENYRVVGLDPSDPITVSYGKPIPGEPTGKTHPNLLKVKPSHGHNQTIVNGISRIGYMKGGQAARWVDEDMADVITGKAVDFIDRSKDGPFFLFFSTHDIHVPRVPHARFAGRSGCGTRGDVMEEIDWCVGELIKALDKNGLTQKTLVIFSSDNGPVLDDGYQDGANEDLNGHEPSGPWRAGKYSLFEGGTRVPFITCWPGRIKPGVSDALMSQVDFPATFARLTGQTLPRDAAPDSLDTLDALLGDSPEGRDHLVSHSGGLVLREGPWKFIPPNKKIRDKLGPWKSANSGPKGMLFNTRKDPNERTNLADQNTEKAKAMADKLQSIQQAGRTRK